MSTYRSPATPPFFTHLALISETQTGIVRHAGRHGHADITGDTHTTMTKAGRTRIFDNGTMSLATLAWSGGHHLAKHGAHHALCVALTMAVGGTVPAGVPFWQPVAGAFLAQTERFDFNMCGVAEHRSLQVDGHCGQCIASRLCTRGRTAVATAESTSR